MEPRTRMRPTWLRWCTLLVVLTTATTTVRERTHVQAFATSDSISSTCKCPVIRTFKFGQSAPLTGSNSLSGTPIRDGILAAFHEYNTQPTSDGDPINSFRFELDAKDDMYIASKAQQNMLSFAQDPTVFGILGNFGTTGIELAAPIAKQYNLPLMSAYGGMGLRQPFQRNIITLRGSYFDESAAIVEYFVSQSKKRISLFAQNDAFGQSAREGVIAALDSCNLYLHSEAYYTKNMNSSFWQQEVKAAIKNMSNSLLSSLPPDAIVIAAVYEPAALFIGHIHELWPETDVVCLSSVSIFGLVDRLAASNDSGVLRNVYSSQFLPNPATCNDIVVQKYRAAAAKVNVTSSNYLTLEGYMMARLAIAALQRIKESNYTQDAFLDVIYSDSFFNIDGFRIGPFYPVDVDRGCNQGIQGSRIVKVYLNKTLVDVHVMGFSTCGYRRKIWNKLTFGQSCSFNTTSSRSALCISFRDGLLAAFKQINDAGGVRGTTRLMLQTKDDFGDPNVAVLNSDAFMEDSEIFALIGTSPLAMEDVIQVLSKGNKMLFGALTGDNCLREPFDRRFVNFRASTFDEISAMVHYCYYTRQLFRISVLYEESEYGNERREQLQVAMREKRLTMTSEASYTSADTIPEAIKKLFSGRGASLQAVVFIGLGDVMAQVLTGIHGRDRDILVLGLSDTIVGLDLTKNEAIAENVNFDNFLLASVVPHPSGADSTLAQEYIHALADLSPLASVSMAGLEGYVVGQLLGIGLTRIMGKELNVANLLDTIYENGNFDVFGLQCGPLQIASNTSTQPSCNQCMKSVFLVRLNGDLVDTFRFDGMCTYQPAQNVDLQVKSLRVPLALLALVGMIYTVINFLMHVVLRKNAHISQIPFPVKIISGIGAIVCFGEVFVLFPVPTNATCIMTPWFIDLSFVLLIGPIIARIIVLDKKAVHKKTKQKRRLRGQVQALIIVVILFVTYVGFLVVYTLVDPPYVKEDYTPEGLRFERCVSKSNTFVYLDHALMGVIMLWGILVCQRLAGTASQINEANRLSMCVYHTALVALCGTMLQLTTVSNPNVQFAGVSVTLMENTLFLVIVLFTRPIYNALRKVPIDLSKRSSAYTIRTQVHVGVVEKKASNDQMTSQSSRTSPKTRSKTKE